MQPRENKVRYTKMHLLCTSFSVLLKFFIWSCEWIDIAERQISTYMYTKSATRIFAKVLRNENRINQSKCHENSAQYFNPI